MFGDLPKIFDRNFVVGYLLPSGSFLAFSLAIIHGRDLLNPTAMNPAPTGGVVFLIFAFLLGIVLLVANRPITRILEGYGRLNPVRLLALLQLVRFRYLQRKLSKADRKYQNAKNSALDKVQATRRRLIEELSEYYPDDEKFLRPSRFGNAVRAFESYPRVMYGLDIIEGWTRLVAVIPEEFLRIVDTAKTEVDLWVNVWFLSISTIIDVFATRYWSNLASYANTILDVFPAWYWPNLVSNATVNGSSPSGMVSSSLSIHFLIFTTAAAALNALFASRMATNAAVEWGSTVKAATDVFLPTLQEKLGFDASSDVETAKKQWITFSQAITYRRPDVMPKRAWNRALDMQQVATPERHPSLDKQIKPTLHTGPNEIGMSPVGSTRVKTGQEDGVSKVDRSTVGAKPPACSAVAGKGGGAPSGDGTAPKMLYFAYGSNMLSRRLQHPSRVPSAIPLATAYLSGHNLTFDKRSRDGSGKCDAEATGVPGDRVYGVVYEIDAAEKPCLDRAEGLGKGYAEKTETVTSGSGPLCSLVYFATDKDRALKPYHWYKNFVVAGAREHSLPSDYIALLEKVESREDPDTARNAREEATLGPL